MSYKIIGDSCTDLTQEMRENPHIVLVPLTLQVGEEHFVDDDSFSQEIFLQKMEACRECPKSGCPSPEEYRKEYEGEEEVYVVTLSSRLSGSYNSAELAKRMYLEKHPEKKIVVINSRSASVGQTLLVRRIQELCESGLSFEEVTKKVKEYRDEMQTKFVLESLENLRKNGRLSLLKAKLAEVLNIKPVMASTPEGEITSLTQARGMKRAIGAMAEIIGKDAVRPQENVLGIAHCANLERAMEVKAAIESQVKFKDCIVVDTGGVSSLYASRGGIIVCY